MQPDVREERTHRKQGDAGDDEIAAEAGRIERWQTQQTRDDRQVLGLEQRDFSLLGEVADSEGCGATIADEPTAGLGERFGCGQRRRQLCWAEEDGFDTADAREAFSQITQGLSRHVVSDTSI